MKRKYIVKIEWNRLDIDRRGIYIYICARTFKKKHRKKKCINLKTGHGQFTGYLLEEHVYAICNTQHMRIFMTQWTGWTCS